MSGAPPLNSKHLFSTLDGMRGVAALAVILFHCPGLLGHVALPHGYLAVDFFFALSGFVLAFAYQGRLDGGWPTVQFLKVRFARLYPLYAVSTLLGMAALLLTAEHPAQMGSPARMGARLLLGLALLPSFAADQFLFPLNFPSWSISFELLANAVHAVLLRRRRWTTLAALCALGAAGTVGYGWRISHLNFGSVRPIAFAGLYRLLFAYTAGMLVCLAWRRRPSRLRVPALLMPLVLTGIFALPQMEAPYRIMLDLALALLVFPPLVLLSARVEPGSGLARVFRFLGAMSYPVYLLHMPLFVALAGMWERVRHRAPLHDAVFGPVFLTVLLGTAVVLERAVDLPARAWMLRWMKAQKASV